MDLNMQKKLLVNNNFFKKEKFIKQKVNIVFFFYYYCFDGNGDLNLNSSTTELYLCYFYPNSTIASE